MPRVTSDIGLLVLGSWHAVTALGMFDYYFGGPVVQRTRYIAAIGTGGYP